MQLTSRWYRDERDLERMIRLVTDRAADLGPDTGILHPGDIVWGLYRNLTIDPAERVRLFEDARGSLRGFVWIEPPRGFTIYTTTRRALRGDDLQSLIRWAEDHLGPGGEPLHSDIVVRDHDAFGALLAAGYRPTGRSDYTLNTHWLEDPVPEPDLPRGASVRPVNLDDPAEIAARVALHQAVWGSATFTEAGYARLRGKPVYRADLDLVAVTPEGELAAYCIVWWDGVNRTGLFEPVGAAVPHRGQGYGTAVVRDGLRRLLQLGARQAIVVSETAAESEPARRLYASVGFDPRWAIERWERPAGDEAAGRG